MSERMKAASDALLSVLRSCSYPLGIMPMGRRASSQRQSHSVVHASITRCGPSRAMPPSPNRHPAAGNPKRSI
jgi:hypothetical protein